MRPGTRRVVSTADGARQSSGIAARARRWLSQIRPDPARRDRAFGLYRELVNQARIPTFYRELGVPDTPEGRFEMVGLHVALVVRRLKAEGASGGALAQELFDLMFEDMDESLRQIGIGCDRLFGVIKRRVEHRVVKAEKIDAPRLRVGE